MTARFLHGEFFEFLPTFKLFLAVNHKPVIKGTDHAIWRRVKLIPFNVTIPEEQWDRTLPDKLQVERSGILRWMVEGCLAWQREGLSMPEAVAAATRDYRAEMDTVEPFIDECCIRTPDAETPSKDLYLAYGVWCEKHGEEPISAAEFGARLAEKGFERRRTKASRGWRGLALLVTG
jgi:putative DNA primase/helicase